jgi:hypothetical protein
VRFRSPTAGGTLAVFSRDSAAGPASLTVLAPPRRPRRPARRPSDRARRRRRAGAWARRRGGRGRPRRAPAGAGLCLVGARARDGRGELRPRADVPGAHPAVPPAKREIFVRGVTPDGARRGPAQRVTTTGAADDAFASGAVPALGYDRRAGRFLLVAIAADPGARRTLVAHLLHPTAGPTARCARWAVRAASADAAGLRARRRLPARVLGERARAARARAAGRR